MHVSFPTKRKFQAHAFFGQADEHAVMLEKCEAYVEDPPGGCPLLNRLNRIMAARTKRAARLKRYSIICAFLYCS